MAYDVEEIRNGCYLDYVPSLLLEYKVKLTLIEAALESIVERLNRLERIQDENEWQAMGDDL